MDYASAGVNIEAGAKAVDQISQLVKSTYSDNVLSGLGHFGAFYRLPSGYESPILVSCTDGVGTKVKMAVEYGCIEGLGQDLVAMCVNDLICCGAKPLFFLDYYACHRLDPDQVTQIVSGIATACKSVGCSLVGGEMAEMNDVYQKGEFDLAGFSVGIVEESRLLTGKTIRPGQFVFGLPSSGIHSNGFSLVRRVLTQSVIEQEGLNPRDILTPTTLYVNPVLSLLDEDINVSALAHITGGGFQENISRLLPDGCGVTIEKSQLPSLPIFEIIQHRGNLPDAEMFKVFNMGIGMVAITDQKIMDPDWRLLGQVEKGDKGVRIIGV